MMLRAVHEADRYPLNWPPDPARWLTPPELMAAWVAELPAGHLAGHVALQHPTGDGEPFRGAELSRLFVDPAARRHSVAAALLGQAETWTTERGLTLTLTVTDEHRSSAIAFYEATGWQHINTTTADWMTPDGTPVRLRHYRR